MTFPRRFKNPAFQKAYEIARTMGADPASTFYVDGKPRTGAGHRCAYWDGRQGKPSTYSDPTITGYPYYRAGVDDRKELDGLDRGPTWKEFSARRKPLA